MVISVFQGIVPVPLFKQPIDYSSYVVNNPNWAAWDFDPGSYGPLHLADAVVDGTVPNDPILTKLVSVMPAVGGKSALTLNPNAVSPFPSGATWFDNVCWIGGYQTIVGTDYTNHYFWWNQQRTPSIQTAPPRVSRSALTFTRMSPISGVMPAFYVGEPVATIFWTDLNFLINASVFDTVHLQIIQSNVFNVSTAAGNFGGQLRNARIYGDHVYDNCLYVSKSGIRASVSRFLYNGAGLAFVQEAPVHLDNATLDILWQAQSERVNSWWNGFIASVDTAGAGPTGQRNEIIVFNQDMSAYWLLKFEAGDADASNQLSAGTGWVTQIDTDGIVWFNNGIAASQAEIFYSFSLSHLVAPQIQGGTLNPIVLPCTNICNPVQSFGSGPGSLY